MLRVRVAGGNARRLGVVVMPRIGTRRLDRAPGSAGRMRVEVRVPHGVRLAGRTVGLYLGRARARRFTRLGAGRLSGGRGRYSASFPFTTVSRMGSRDFVGVCVAGVHRQGMGYGTRLDRACGAGSVRF